MGLRGCLVWLRVSAISRWPRLALTSRVGDRLFSCKALWIQNALEFIWGSANWGFCAGCEVSQVKGFDALMQTFLEHRDQLGEVSSCH